MSTTYRVETDNGDYEIEVDESSQEDHRPSSGEKFNAGLNNVADKISRGMAFIDNPGGKNVETNSMEFQGQNLFNKMGENTAEYLGGKNIPGNPYTAAAAGTAVSFLNPQNWMAPAKPGPLNVGKPVVPPERMAGVTAAQEAGVPLSRAEQTGGRFVGGLEKVTEKTPMGELAMGKMRSEGDAAMQAYKERLQSKMGTPKEKFDVGYEAKPAMDARADVMNQKRNAMFEAIPTEVHIPLSEYQKIGDTILQEQSKVRPLARDAEISKFASDAQTPYGSTGEGVTGGPDYSGVTTKTPDEIIPGKNIITQKEQKFSPDAPYQRTESGEVYQDGSSPEPYNVRRTKDKLIEGENVYGVKASVGPEQKFQPKSNYADVKALRETLNSKIQEARKAGNYGKERQFLRLKSALDKDIEGFANAPASPLDSMTAQEFKKTYGQANAFSGAYKKLFKGDLAEKIATAPAEKILDMVFQKNNETAIKKFRALVGEEAFNTAKQKWANEILESPNVTKALSEKKIDPGTLKAILGGPEQEALSKYGAVQDIRSSREAPGTVTTSKMIGHTLSYAAIFDGLRALASGDFLGAAAYGGAFVSPYVVGKALTSSAATHGVTLPAHLSHAVMREFISRIRMKDDQQ